MSQRNIDRRSFLAYAGVTGAAAAAAPWIGASPVVAAPATLANISPTRTQDLLADFVDMRFGMFLHYSLGTYTDEEWASPNQSPLKFAPTSVDCAQWAAAAKAAKMEYAVLTTKHHDGFSLWPTKFGQQNVAFSSFRQDVVRNYVDSFRAQGLKVGFYFSIWDRTAGIEAFGGHVGDQSKTIEPADMDIVLGQLTELLSGYGPIDLLMTDGYTWQMGQQAINYERVRSLVKELQPDCLLTDICAVTEPWLGDAIFWEEPFGITAPPGNTYAGVQGQTISNGWFWHPATPTEALMSEQSILEHLRDTEPRYTSFLLNCPPNRNGRLDDNVVRRLEAVGKSWPGPDASRPRLPQQQAKVEWPIVPVAAHTPFYNTEWGLNENAYKAIDFRADNGFETCWSTWTPSGTGSLPATLILDLGGRWSSVSTLQYLPKQWRRTGSDGDVTSAVISVSLDGRSYTPVATASWGAGKGPKTIEWPEVDAAFVKFEVTAATGNYVNVNGIKVGGREKKPVRSPLWRDGSQIRISNKATGQNLVLQNGTATVGSETDTWIVRDAEDNYHYLEHRTTGGRLALSGTSRSSGSSVEVRAPLRAFQQHWALTPLEDGAYVLTNRFNMQTLGIRAGQTPALVFDANLNTATQQWEVVSLVNHTDLSTAATTRVVAGKIVLVVQIVNRTNGVVYADISTSFGATKTVVKPGQTVNKTFSTRQSSIPSGEVLVSFAADSAGTDQMFEARASYPAAAI